MKFLKITKTGIIDLEDSYTAEIISEKIAEKGIYFRLYIYKDGRGETKVLLFSNLDARFDEAEACSGIYTALNNRTRYASLWEAFEKSRNSKNENR